jgi:hypothetical protein
MAKMPQPCGHPGCQCTVDSLTVGETYCSEVCASETMHEHADNCPCGHSACAH